MKRILLLLSAILLLAGCKEKAMSITVNLRYKHHATPMMDTIAKLREKYDLYMTLERYTAAETPETENKFIRK